MRPTDDAQPSLPEIGALIEGGYRVERVIATGGMGVVLEAHQEALDRKVALKLLKRAGDERAARLLREARAAAAIDSDHVAHVYDVGRLATGEPFIAMELLEGVTLADALERDGPLETSAAVDVVLQACVALAEAHERSIVHRDLKPSNLFLARQAGNPPIVKVLDFGISKVESAKSAITETGLQLGTPVYMAPEQVRDARNADARSDIWALGVVLFELMTGVRPFEAPSLPGIGASIVADPPRRLTESRSEAPVELERIILRCLEKEPLARYQTVADLARALAPFASEQGRATAERVTQVVRDTLAQSNELAPTEPAGPTAATQESETLDATSAPTSSSPGRRKTTLALLVAVAVGAVAIGLVSRPSAPSRPAAAPTPSEVQLPRTAEPPEVEVPAATGASSAPAADPDAAAAKVDASRTAAPRPRAPAAVQTPPRSAPAPEPDPFEHRK